MSDGVLIALIVAGTSIVTGGGVWSYLTRRKDRGHEAEQGEIGRLREDLALVKAQHEKCEEKVDRLVERLAALEQHHASLIPRWIKDARKRIIWVNSRALITIFAPLGFSRDQIEGHTFQELLDVEAAREIDRLDAAALQVPGMPVSTLVTLHHCLDPMHVVKIAGVGHDGELIYEGCAFSVNDPEQVRKRAMNREQEQVGLSVLRLGGPCGPETGPCPPLTPQSDDDEPGQ